MENNTPGAGMTQEDIEDFKLLEEYDLKERIAKMVAHIINNVPQENKQQILVNCINSLVGSAILHHNNRHVKKLQVPDFKTTFNK